MNPDNRGEGSDRGDPKSWADRAAAHLAEGRLDRAASDYLEAIRRDPRSASIQNDYGVALSLQRKPEEAADRYREAIRIDPGHAEAHNNLGNACRELGRPDEAARSYREAIRLRPGYAEASTNLALVLMSGGEAAEAIALLEQALRHQPASPDSWFLLGLSLRAQGRADAAVVCLEHAARLKPDHADAQLSLALALGSSGRPDEAERAFREAIRLRPKDARARFEWGMALSRQGRMEEALRELSGAAEADPDDPEIPCNIGLLLGRLDRPEEAKDHAEAAGRSAEAAMGLRPGDARAYKILGDALGAQGRMREAAENYRRAVDLEPGFKAAHHALGVARHASGRFDEAIASFTRCLEIDPEDADAHCERAAARLASGESAMGWPELEWRPSRRRADPRLSRSPAWMGGPLDGKRILLSAEPDLGDSILFVRHAAILKERGAHVIFSGPEPLARLLERTPGIDQVAIAGRDLPDHDTHAHVMSLPALCGLGPDHPSARAPYVFADPARVERWRARLGPTDGLRVGLGWHGGPAPEGGAHDLVTLRRFAPIAKVPGVRLVSLPNQRGLEQVSASEGMIPIEVLGRLPVDGDGEPLLDAAAVLANLDLVITADTDVAHLAGAMGVPAWLAASAAPDWRWMAGRRESPLYPTVRVFRQETLGDWPGVFGEMAAALARLARHRRGARWLGLPVTPGEFFERVATLELELEMGTVEAPRRLAREELDYLKRAMGTLLGVSRGPGPLLVGLKEALRDVKLGKERLHSSVTAADDGDRVAEIARGLDVAQGRLSEILVGIDDLELF